MPATLSQWFSLRNLSAHAKGYLAENIGFCYLLLKGYTPFPRPGKVWAQTDLLMRRGHVLAVVEVKYRPTRERGHLALHPAQKQRLHRQLWALAAQNPTLTVRLDLLLVFPTWPFIAHVQALDLPARPTYHPR